MALKATIFKADVQISDMDRHYYEHHSLTLARHPSETDERMMTRLLAFILFADPQLSFTRGISTIDEPDLWQKSLSDEIEVWIELGLPDAKRLGKASGRAEKVQVMTYAGRNAELWWDKIKPDLQRFKNISVLNIPFETVQSLTEWVDRSMQIQALIEDGTLWLSSEERAIEVTPEYWQEAK